MGYGLSSGDVELMLDNVESRQALGRVDRNSFDDFDRLFRRLRFLSASGDMSTSLVRGPEMNPLLVVAEVLEPTKLPEANVASHRRLSLLKKRTRSK